MSTTGTCNAWPLKSGNPLKKKKTGIRILTLSRKPCSVAFSKKRRPGRIHYENGVPGAPPVGNTE